MCPKVIQNEPKLQTKVEVESISYPYEKFHAGIERCDEKFWEATEDGFGKMGNMPKTDPNYIKYEEVY